MAESVEILKEGNVCLDLERCQAFVGKRKVNLTATEFNLLACLLSNRGKVLSREQLLEELWGDSYPGSERTIDTHMQRLRRKLGRTGRRIRTVRGIGYELVRER